MESNPGEKATPTKAGKTNKPFPNLKKIVFFLYH